MESNKIIAEFMGLRIVDGYLEKYVDSNTEPKKYWTGRPKTFEFQIWGWQITHHESKVLYHSDWNWLMEVVEKIEGVGYSFTIIGNLCIVSKPNFKSIRSEQETKFEAVYNACVEFIQWYNEN